MRRPITTHDLKIQTDASIYGWGYTIDTRAYWGTWQCSTIKTGDMAILELLTIAYALANHAHEATTHTVHVVSDNAAAVAILNDTGAARGRMVPVAQHIALTLAHRGLHSHATHIPSTQNTTPDRLSRMLRLPPHLRQPLEATATRLTPPPLIHQVHLVGRPRPPSPSTPPPGGVSSRE